MPSGRSTPVLPPTEESTCASSVVGDLAQRHAAQEGRRGKAGDVADNTAAERDDQILAGHAGGQQIMVNASTVESCLCSSPAGMTVCVTGRENCFPAFEIQRRYR